MKIIEIEDFVKNYKADTDTWIKYKNKIQGECIGLPGKSRGDKSIELHIINNADSANQTDKTVNAEQNGGKRLNIEGATVGYILKNYGLCECETVRSNVLLPLYFSNKYKPKEYGERCSAVLKACGIEHAADETVSELYGPERFRTAAARALAANPDIVIIDESSITSELIDYETVIDVFVTMHEMGKFILILPDTVSIRAYLEKKENRNRLM